MAYTQTVSPKVSYNDPSTTGTMMRNVVPVFDLVSPRELPLLKAISGGSDDRPSLNSLSETCTATKFEWLEDQDPAYRVQIGTTITSAATAGYVHTFGGSYTLNFRVGDIVQVDDEQMLVTALTSATSVTLTRAWGGTSGAAHNTTTAYMTIVGRTHEEGTDAPDDLPHLGTLPYNAVQEFTASFKLSDIEAAVKRYGIRDAVEFETDFVTRNLLRRMERQCIYGKRVVGASGTPAAFGGLAQYVSTTASVGGNITKALINTGLETVFNNVGAANMPDTFLVSATGKRYLSTIYSGATNYTTFRDQADPVGGSVVEIVRTDVCELKVLLVNDMPDSIIYAVKLDKLGVGPLKGKEMKRELLAKTGTSEKFMVSGAYTMQVRSSLSHYAWLGVSGVA